MRERPKSEIRSPKEGRNPKAEWPDEGAENGDSEFWVWGDEPTSESMVLHDGPGGRNTPPRDLTERTACFGEAIIEFAKKIPQNPVNNRLINQLVGAGTSVAANFYEADDAVSGKEFKQKIGYSRKESKETILFLRLVAKAEPDLAPQARTLWREAKELNLILGAIWRK
jgi:four helix bundle protein